ncbi:MAG: hypothetical protein HZC01_05020 [Candidatus Kerfeldbacteria bacterium]|nr:hypothetical protein [Candidatus Kerfeldbacteria bacterium]
MLKNSFFAVAIILTAVFSISFFGNFDFSRNYINLPLLISVYLIIQSHYERGFIFAAGAGLIFDMYSSSTAGTYTLAMVVPLVVMFYAFRSLFARKSMYAIILMMIVSTIMYHLFIWGLTEFFYLVNWREFRSSINSDYIISLCVQLSVHVALIVCIHALSLLVGRHVVHRFRLNPRV